MPKDQIEIGVDGETLPVVEVLTGRAFLTGKSGSGKSNSASVVAEQLLSMGLPLVIVDTDGEYWGLKEEYEILHVGADEECDLQVGPEHAEKLASLALEENVPIILDVSAYLERDTADALIRETARHLFAKEKKLDKPFLLVVEEIHEYIPQSGGLDDVGEMLIRVAKRGRKRGLGIAGISQRPASVDKDFITQCDWLVWHRLTWDNDISVVKSVLGPDYEDAVKGLDDGEAFLQTDFMEEQIQRVQFKRKQTFDAGARPGLDDVERPDLKSVSADLVGELEEISEREERRQDRIAELEAEIEERDERIQALEEQLEEAKNMQDMAQQFTEAMTSVAGGDSAEAIQERVEEIREEKQSEIRELKTERDELRERLADLQEGAQELRERVAELEEYEQAVENLDELEEAVIRMNEALGLEADGDTERYRKQVQQRENRIEELEREVQRLRESGGEALLPEDAEYIDFLKQDAVQDAIDQAKEDTSGSQKYIEDVLTAIVEEGGGVDYETAAEYAGISGTSHISKAVSALTTVGVVEKSKQNGRTHVDLNLGGIEEIVRKRKKREQAEQLKGELFNG